MSYLTADDFLRGVLAEPVDFEVAGLGTVRLRGLTVGEVAVVKREARTDATTLLAQTIALGMVEPQMTLEQLLSAPAGIAQVYEQIGVRIAELSGLGDKPETQEQLDAFPGGGS